MRPVQLASSVWRLAFPVGHVHLVRLSDGYALVDTGLPGSSPEILDALAQLGVRPHDVRQIVLTHAHVDHTGSAAALVAATGAQVLAGRADAAAVRGEAPHPQPALDSSLERWLFEKVTTDVAAHAGDSPEPFGPPPVPVDRELEDGDALDGWGAGARVLHVPGHTPGSVALHLPAEGVLFPGDNVAEAEGRVVLGPFNVDRAQAVASFRRLAALDDVGTVCVPHGEPLLSDVGRRLREATPEADWI